MKRFLIISLLFFSISATSLSQVFTLKDSIIHLGDVMRVTIYFNYDVMEILPESFPLLDSISHFIRGQKDFGFEVSYHTDERGDDKYNRRLSELRAQIILGYLIGQGGIERQRVRATGCGEDRPLISPVEISKMSFDKQLQAHALNQRTELTVICLTGQAFQSHAQPRFSAENARLEETYIIDTEYFDPKDGPETLLLNNDTIDGTIKELESWLIAHPLGQIEISVHSDTLGDANYNMTNSERKANSLLRYLESRGISKDAFTITGYGETKPLIPDKSIARMCITTDQEKAHKINCRVEVKILRN